jgi:hypothetical protein
MGTAPLKGEADEMDRCKHLLLLATLAATALICAVTGTASARNFSVSTLPWRAVWTAFEIRNEAGVTWRCPLTLEGSFHTRTFAKVAESLIGYVHRAAIGPCPIETRLLSETLPWHLRYRSFIGVLPNITAISVGIVGFAIQIREPTITCLGTSTAAAALILTINRGIGGALGEATPSPSATITTSCTPFGSQRLTFANRSGGLGTSLTLI